MYWVLVISIFTPGGDLVNTYQEGPIESKTECIARKKELNDTQNVMSLKITGKCIRLKVDKD
jgi:hypothetical protein